MLRPPNLIHRLVQMLGDVKAVQNIQGMPRHLSDDFEIRLPHVAADVTQFAQNLRTQLSQAAPQRGLGSSPSHPQESPAMLIDLVDHGQKLVCSLALAPVDLVNADRMHRLKLPMCPLFHCCA